MNRSKTKSGGTKRVRGLEGKECFELKQIKRKREKEASPKGREYLTMGEITDKGSGIIRENPLSGRFCFPVDSK